MNVCPECGQTFPEGGFCTQDGAPLVSGADEPLVGAMLGPYRVAHVIGVGGMGRVYKGINPTIRSRVAIKVLSHDCADRPELVDRFFAEARAVNLIRHENIVNVLDLARLDDGRPYIIMEFLDGAPLSRLLAQHGRIPLGTMARFMADVLAGLGAAHAKGVVHRDLKPDNVIITQHGRAKILDFGVAKLASGDGDGLNGPNPTRAGSLIGTPHYMSPEQAQARPIDARADIYAIGVILYEAATGRRPLEGDSMFEILRKQVEEDPVPPRRLAPDIPAAYERVILRAMEKDPNRRWQSAEELARALGEATAGLPPAAWEVVGDRTRPDPAVAFTPRTPGLGPRPVVRRSRTPLLVAAGMALAGAAIAGFLVSQKKDTGSGPVVGSSPPAAAQPAAAASLATSQSPAASQSLAASESPAPSPRGPASSGASAPASPEPAPAGPVAGPDGAPSGRMAADTPAQSVDEPAAHAGRDRAEPGKKGGPEPGRPGSREPPATGDGETTASDEHASDKNAPAHADGPSESGEPIGGEAPRDQPNQIGNSWDVSGYLAKALARARRKFSDAVLIRIDADGVYPSGQADLTLDEHFSVLYRFMSPSRARRPADLPQGVKHKPTCIYYVLVDHDSISSYALEGWSCEDEHQIPMPRCSAREIWRRAAADRAPTKNAVASLSYRHNTGGKALWWFSIGDRHQLRFEDDCQK